MAQFTIWTELGFVGNPYDHNDLSGTAEGAALFCGRHDEQTRVQLGIGSGGAHVSIEGEAGVGKSSLARVAAFEMLRRALDARNGTIFLPVSAPMQLGDDPTEFERSVWRNIANTLIANEHSLLRVGRDPADLGSLRHWLNSPTTITGGSVNVLGFGASGDRTLNTTTGFGESGFISLVRSELARVFPTPATGGVVCILDNLELLGTSEAARRSLESIRGVSRGQRGKVSG